MDFSSGSWELTVLTLYEALMGGIAGAILLSCCPAMLRWPMRTQWNIHPPSCQEPCLSPIHLSVRTTLSESNRPPKLLHGDFFITIIQILDSHATSTFRPPNRPTPNAQSNVQPPTTTSSIRRNGTESYQRYMRLGSPVLFCNNSALQCNATIMAPAKRSARPRATLDDG